ncbi:MAG: L-threonylcarbamoyladenylate synthase [Glycocaulis sp.]
MNAPPLPVLDASVPAHLDRAAAILREGGLVAVPTETVYGLAADATNARAVAALYEAKGRPRFNPLIAHVDGLERALRLVELCAAARALAAAFWPGPLTLVGKRKDGAPVCDLAAAGLDTLAVRWPDAPAMTGLISRLDRPLVAPSANPSGRISPTSAAHVVDGLTGRIAMVLDGGPCRLGLESTIIADTPEGLVLLRPGALPREQIEAVTGGALPAAGSDAAVSAPGMLTSHYAPQARLRLDVTAPGPDEIYLAFGHYRGIGAKAVLDLSPTGNLAEAAANLFSLMRKADQMGDRIACAPIPVAGLGEAINDRLARAAAPRQS